jgi:hypothetical protein
MNWQLTAQHQLKFFLTTAFLAFALILTAAGGVNGADGSGLTLNLLSDPANPTNTYPLGETPQYPIKLIMVLKNTSGQQINVERGLSQVELHRTLIVKDPCEKILELDPEAAETLVFDAPPPRFVGGRPLVPAEILQADFVRSLTIDDLRQLFPVMKQLPGTYRVSAQLPASRFVWTLMDKDRGLQGVADHPSNWFGTINAAEMQILILPEIGAQLEVIFEDAGFNPLRPVFQAPVKVFKNSDIPDGSEPSAIWAEVEPVISGVTNTKGQVVWGSCKTCVPIDDYTIMGFYRDAYQVTQILSSDSGWSAGCGGEITRKLTYTEKKPELTVTITGEAYNYPEVYPFTATFSMDVTSEGSQPSGWLNYYYSRYRMNLASTAITEISASGTQGTIKGTCAVNGKDGYSFEAQITDDNPDMFGITIRKEAGTIYFTAPLKEINGGDLTITILGAVEIAGDFDGDGDVDGSDLKALAAAYAQGDLSADLNNDDSVNSADVEYFTERFGIMPTGSTEGGVQYIPGAGDVDDGDQSPPDSEAEDSPKKKPPKKKKKHDKKKDSKERRRERKINIY